MDFTPLARFGLLLVRPGMLVMIAPGIGGAHLSVPVKVGLSVLLALGLLPSVPLPAVGSDVTLTVVIVREMAIGMALALTLRSLIVAVEFAGHLAGYQIGYSYGATIDPQSGVHNTMIAALYGSLATMAFLGINGHHMLLRALAASYGRVPIGAGHIDASLVVAVRQLLGMVFLVGARLAAPVVIVLLIIELAVGLIARSSPSLSFMVIGFPIRLIFGLLVLSALLSSVPAVTVSMMDRVFSLATATAGAFR